MRGKSFKEICNKNKTNKITYEFQQKCIISNSD